MAGSLLDFELHGKEPHLRRHGNAAKTLPLNKGRPASVSFLPT
jgi:hypothetical protein